MYLEKNRDSNDINVSVIDQNIIEEMKKSYISYSMSVIIGRALPDVRDGLKSVHRRILYSMNESGVTSDKQCKKSARIVGNVLGKYHPHGDSSVYDAIVRMVQPFSLRYPLIEGQGNFGSIDGDSAAAMRYTEVKLCRISREIMNDIEKETVKFKSNYDGSLQEPIILPSKLPNLLVNGSTGIAVGMATNMPPHNLSEVVDALLYFIDNKCNATIGQLMNIIKGPDFPTGGVIFNYEGLKNAYETGKGVIKIRGVHKFENLINDKKRLVIVEIPYQVNKSKLVETIAHCVREKIICGISDLRDESDRNGIRIVLDLIKGANEELILNSLYKHTQLEISFGIINLAIVNSIPKILNLLDLLSLYIFHRLEIIQKRTEYDLKISNQKLHILQGLKIASSNIHDIINLIKKSDNIEETKHCITKKYFLDSVQVKSIMELRLQRLTNIESQKIESEIAIYSEKIVEYNKILSSEEEKYKIIREELLDLKEKYGDSRRSLVLQSNIEKHDIEDLIKKEDIIVTLTNNGYIKRLPVSTYTKQNRGGKGIIGIEVINSDSVKSMFVSSTHDYILFFTNKGKVYWKKAYNIPEFSRISKGKAIINFLNLENNEFITALFSVSNFNFDSFLIFVTKYGIVKRILLSEFKKPRKNGLIAIVLNENDELISVKITKGNNNFILATSYGKAVCVNENEIRVSRRISKGVIGIRLHKEDFVVGMEIVNFNETLLTLTKNGFGKRTSYDEYLKKHKGTYGVKSIVTNNRNGPVVSVLSISENDDLIITSADGIIIRLDASNVSHLKRNTQGVKLMNLNNGDFVSCISKIKTLIEDKE